MKRTIAVILVLILLFALISCQEMTDISKPDDTADVSSETVTSDEQTSRVTVSKEDKPANASNIASSDTSSYVLKNYDVEVGEYDVNDAENSRGLSNKKEGFGFGVAKDGKPHQISVDNQARFDKMSDVKALALDTVSTDKRMYLTFDCGYEYEYKGQKLTPLILDTLKEKNTKAAFFVTLSFIKSNPETVHRMIDEGHIVGNHSATHPVFPDISRTKMAEELYKVDEYLQKHFNYKTDYFRFPTGANSYNALELVTSVGYKSIFWSVAYGDYDTENQMGAEKAFQTVTSRFHPGAVILLHASSIDNVNILSDVIDEAEKQGYELKTLDDYKGF